MTEENNKPAEPVANTTPPAEQPKPKSPQDAYADFIEKQGGYNSPFVGRPIDGGKKE